MFIVSENFADHSKFWLLAPTFKLLDPDTHSEAGSEPGGNLNADPDPQHCFNGRCVLYTYIPHLPGRSFCL
jgi:hypothetical protein